MLTTLNLAAFAAAAALGCGAQTPPMAAEPRTADAAIAADRAWSAAEEGGDTAYVDRLLMPEYRSVGSDGVSTTKAQILARVGATQDPVKKQARAAKVAAWRAIHPNNPVVTLAGDTAIVAWTSVAESAPVYSIDLFVYRDGRWRALYSQHTAAGA